MRPFRAASAATIFSFDNSWPSVLPLSQSLSL
jgi:hypothetical protein